jgi:glycosyltransferase involved in cell wall biosynthesis
MSEHAYAQTDQAAALGVSIAICSHNGEKLLPATLGCLKKQYVTQALEWEVLVIDNASTDNTASVARQCWGEDAPAPLRVISEPRLGLCYARTRAFNEAKHEIVSFIDDDNWVMPEWVATASQCMSMDSQLGALGSTNTAVADAPLPEWFSRHSCFYAAWDYPDSATIATSLLIGAGMTVRKSVWQWLHANGFHQLLSGRIGSRLTSSEDVELGCAIRLAGWNVRIEPRLQLKHYMTGNRLSWKYLRRLKRSVGESHTILDSYRLVYQSDQADIINRLRQSWWVRFGKELLYLVSKSSISKLVRSCFRDMEGDDEVAETELQIGRLAGLLRLRSRYGQIRSDVARARWRRVNSVDEAPLPPEDLSSVLRLSDQG